MTNSQYKKYELKKLDLNSWHKILFENPNKQLVVYDGNKYKKIYYKYSAFLYFSQYSSLDFKKSDEQLIWDNSKGNIEKENFYSSEKSHIFDHLMDFSCMNAHPKSLVNNLFYLNTKIPEIFKHWLNSNNSILLLALDNINFNKEDTLKKTIFINKIIEHVTDPENTEIGDVFLNILEHKKKKYGVRHQYHYMLNQLISDIKIIIEKNLITQDIELKVLNKKQLVL